MMPLNVPVPILIIVRRVEANVGRGDGESVGGRAGCRITLLLLYEQLLDTTVAALLPINALRNAALVAAETPLVAMVDVDLLLSRGLDDEIKDKEK